MFGLTGKIYELQCKRYVVTAQKFWWPRCKAPLSRWNLPVLKTESNDVVFWLVFETTGYFVSFLWDMFSLILYMFKIQLVLFYLIHKILSREIISNNLWHWNLQLNMKICLWNMEYSNSELPIFRNFKITNFKIAKDELFDYFIYEFIFHIVFLNYLNTQKIW